MTSILTEADMEKTAEKLAEIKSLKLDRERLQAKLEVINKAVLPKSPYFSSGSSTRIIDHGQSGKGFVVKIILQVSDPYRDRREVSGDFVIPHAVIQQQLVHQINALERRIRLAGGTP